MLIAAVLSGNAGVAECAALRAWMEADEANQRLFEEYRQAWMLGVVGSGAMSEYDVAAAYARFCAGVGARDVGQAKQQQRHRPLSFWLRHAAVWAALLTVGGLAQRYYAVRTTPTAYYETIVPMGAKSQLVLTDGSRVWLNAGSKLRYSTDFAISNRKVELEGEGYFEVASNKALPFEVKTSRLNVRALGTAFNVKAYPNEPVIETILVHGKVEVTRTQNGEAMADVAVVMKPNQRLTLLKSTDELLLEAKPNELSASPSDTVAASGTAAAVKKVKSSANYMIDTSWKDVRWRIESEPLGSLAVKLERRYNVQISFADSTLRGYRFNGTLEDEPVEAVLKAMSLVAPVSYECKGAKIVLSINEKFREEHKKMWQLK